MTQRIGAGSPGLKGLAFGDPLGLFHQFFDHSLEAVLLTRPSGEFLAANSVACAVFGAGESDLCARSRSGGHQQFADPCDPRRAQLLADRREQGQARGGVRA